MKKILFILFCLLINFSLAENFNIDEYSVDLKVNKDNTIQVQETIDAYFHRKSHGIYRTIPLKSNIISVDKNETRKIRISNLKINENYSATFSDDNVTIRMGDENRYVYGKHSYKINYTLDLGKDTLDDKDEFYFNIIGNQWDVNIDKVYFNIQMPKEFDKEKIGFSVGKYGTQGYKNEIKYNVNENNINGYSTKKLLPKEGITIRIELPNEYFIPKNYEKERKNTIFASIFLTFLAFFCWFFIGKDDKVISVVNFRPPKGLNSAEVGVAYKGYIDYKVIPALMVDLANKNYVKIETLKSNFIIHKLKDYKGEKSSEKILMHALFGEGKTQVTKRELEKSKTFYIECQKIIADLNKFVHKIFEKDSISPSSYILPLISTVGLILLSMNILTGYNLIGCQDIIYAILPVLAIFIVTLAFVLTKILIIKLLALFWAIPFIVVPPVILGAWGFFDFKDFYTLLVPLAGLAISIICFKEMPKRNKLGVKLLGHILGFKKFIEVAEIDKIKKLIKDDPKYGMDIIPYAYVLGIEKAWLKALENINYKIDDYNYNYTQFKSFSNNFYKTTLPSTSNGGISESSSNSSSGGSFSGGGHGGGGGGSW